MAAGEGYPDRRSLSRRLRRYPAFGRDETTIRRPFGKLRVALSIVEGRHDGLAAAPFGAFRTKSTKLSKATKKTLISSMDCDPLAATALARSQE
jgi:hypothetical protein